MNVRTVCLAALLALTGQAALAQNKTDLSNGVKGQLDLSTHVTGQLPAANATNVLAQAVNLAPTASQNVAQPTGTTLTVNNNRLCKGSGLDCSPTGGATYVGVAADGSVTAENGSSEKGYFEYRPEGTNADGSTHVAGWGYEQNVAVSQGHIVPTTDSSGNSKPMGLVRSFIWDNATSLFAQGNLYFGGTQFPNNSNCIGFNNAAKDTASSSAAQRLAVCFGNNTAYFINGNATTTPVYFPNAATWCTVTLWIAPDHKNPGLANVAISVVQIGTNWTVTSTLADITPIAGITNFEISGQSPNDLQYNTRYAVGGNGATEHWNIAADDTHFGLASVLTSTTANGIFVLIPPTYRPGRMNRGVLYLHGLNEPGYSISCQSPFNGCNVGVAQMALGLMNAGYVQIGINQSNPACYGNSTCLAELQATVAEIESKLSIAPGLYGYAESMGGFEILNSIAQGLVSFRAIGCMDCNTNLAWDYYPNYLMPDGSTATEAGTATSLINAAYGIGNAAQYPTLTAGFDPQLSASGGGTPLANLVAVPMLMRSSYSDQAVWRQANTDLFANTLNAAGGQVTVETCTGLHEDPSCFLAPSLVAFFNAH